LIKNKGKIMDDWDMPDEVLGYSSNEILEKSGKPMFSALLNNEHNLKTKT
jgi:hypothetical protein